MPLPASARALLLALALAQAARPVAASVAALDVMLSRSVLRGGSGDFVPPRRLNDAPETESLGGHFVEGPIALSLASVASSLAIVRAAGGMSGGAPGARTHARTRGRPLQGNASPHRLSPSPSAAARSSRCTKCSCT